MVRLGWPLGERLWGDPPLSQQVTYKCRGTWKVIFISIWVNNGHVTAYQGKVIIVGNVLSHCVLRIALCQLWPIYIALGWSQEWGP